MKTLYLSGFKVAAFFISFKDAPPKIKVLGAIQKLASLNPWRQNAEWRKTPTDSTVTNPKYVQITIFLHILHISRAHEQGQVCTYGFMGKICLEEKFLRF